MFIRNRYAVAILILSMIIATAAISAAARQKKPQMSKEAREIQAVLDRQVAAWNRRDLEGFMDGYWKSPSLSFYSGGTKTSGWQSTIDRYRNRYQGEGREMGELTFSDIQIELLGPRAAFVRGRWHLKMEAGDAGGLFTLIFREISSEWKIVHDHTGSS
ncbi:MAG: DUF4440 domain-containing protein [Blastocatellia bacterium]|nr:DUF4440 domain-containing protein [Blastocatellia bacterium]